MMKKIILKVFTGILLLVGFVGHAKENPVKDEIKKQAELTLRKTVLVAAKWAMQQKPVTVTAESSSRSAGGLHDFFSEGDYWWPDPKNPDGPYIQRDGMTNPDNFVAHRLAMIRFSKIIGALASAYRLTGEEQYAKQASVHLKAWFISKGTKMNPSLQFAQAIKAGSPAVVLESSIRFS